MTAPIPLAFQELVDDDPVVAKWLTDNIVNPGGGGDLQSQINILDARVDGNDTDISTLQTNVTNNDTDISTLQTNVTNNDTDISALQTDVTNLQNTNIEDWETGTGTLASGTVTITLGATQSDASYQVLVTLTAAVDETLYVDTKTTTTFDVTSANGSSTATFDWLLVR